MSNEIGDGARNAFGEVLNAAGEDCQIGGETKRALVKENHAEGIATFSLLPGEFAIKPGDKIKRWATEADYLVISAKQHATAGTPVRFVVTAGILS